MNEIVRIIADAERDSSEAAEYSAGTILARQIVKDLGDAGYAIVPMEPTQGMLDAAYDCKRASNAEFPSGESSPCAIDPSGEEYWRAMIGAALPNS